jgi:hypothetical protein
MNQSCLDLIGTAGISAADCTEVQKALDAVEMSSPWPCVSGTPTPSFTPSSTPTPSATPPSTPTLTVTATPTPTPACGATPRAICASAPKGRVLIKHVDGRPDRDRLRWKWLAGSAAISDFGDPTSSTTYSLCVYAGGEPWGVFEVPPGIGWRASGSGVLTYTGDLSADGIQVVKLKPGSGRAKIVVRGRGPNLGLATAAVVQPLTVQLVRRDAPDCWQSTFPAPALTATDTIFKDRLP